MNIFPVISFKYSSKLKFLNDIWKLQFQIYFMSRKKKGSSFFKIFFWDSEEYRCWKTTNSTRLQELGNKAVNEQESINNSHTRTRKWIRTKHLYQERITRGCVQDFRWGIMFTTGLEDIWSKYISKEPDLLWSASSDDKIINKIIK